MPEELPEEPKSASDWSRLSGIGFELAAAVGGSRSLGYLWDRHFGSRPWGTLIGAVLGLTGGMYNLISQSLIATAGGRPAAKRRPRRRRDDDGPRSPAAEYLRFLLWSVGDRSPPRPAGSRRPGGSGERGRSRRWWRGARSE